MNEQRETTEWIRIVDKRPETGQIVLFVSNIDPIWQWAYKKVLLGRFVDVSGEPAFVLHPPIDSSIQVVSAIPGSHWMPLPPLPGDLI